MARRGDDARARAELDRSSFLKATDESVHPSVMQALARHFDPKLALARYTHVEKAEQVGGVAAAARLVVAHLGQGPTDRDR